MAEEGTVIAVHTVESWKEEFQKGKDSKKLVSTQTNFNFFITLTLFSLRSLQFKVQHSVVYFVFINYESTTLFFYQFLA